MKVLYRCEYCNETGTEEEITEHETTCLSNYTKKSCFTCKHRSGFTAMTCGNGKEIPKGKFFEQCSDYEWDEKDHATRYPFSNLFGF